MKPESADYFNVGLQSRGHTPIYKIHKYFARRPHNQFRAFIDHYVPKEGVVLDCFAGGGVSLVEGLTVDRRVIAVDVNPVASLVQRAQVLEISAADIDGETTKYANAIRDAIGEWFTTDCRACESKTDYRWVERAYIVACPACSSTTVLDEKSKSRSVSGKPINGKYDCNECAESFSSVDVPRAGSVLLSIRYRCQSCGTHETVAPSAEDIQRDADFKRQEVSLLSQLNVKLPDDDFPRDWDRQREDALFRKGFVEFKDLFTPRNRVFLGLMLKEARLSRHQLSDELYVGVITQISSLIRYINSMTFSTNSWMDGRPVAWAKHAYWTPNQYVEVNPFEYLQLRQDAFRSWERDRNSRFQGKLHSSEPIDVINGVADYSVVCGDSRKMTIPDGCVDAVITDPPFGSNVQYGELTHFWQVWLRDGNPYESDLFSLDSEILVHRKRAEASKTMGDYEEGLRQVFAECNRVLKPTGFLVFTFNNKNPDAWFAVMNAAFSSGFTLDRDAIHYVEEIGAYRDTAHLRYDSELQGDILYSFRKLSPREVDAVPQESPLVWLQNWVSAAASLSSSSEKRLALDLHLGIIGEAAKSLRQKQVPGNTQAWLALLGLIGKSKRAGQTVIDTCLSVIGES